MSAGTLAPTPPVTPVSVGPRYKWIVLSNTTIGVLLSSLNASSLMIALPVIFRGIGLDPLAPANFPYLLWMMMGYMLVVAALVVTVGRIGDIFGRVRMYNLGFAWFTVASILLSCVWGTGAEGAMQLVIFRMVQAVGGALLFANSAAIITDAFPSEQLGFALGTNMMAAIVGGFLGILVGGVLSQAGWRWVFLANVPVGLFGTLWAYLQLKEIGVRVKARIDWLGNIAFAGGLALLLTGVTYGIKPYGGSLTGWSNPFVLETIFGGLALLVIFVIIEARVKDPMFRLSLFRIKAFTAGNVAQFLGSVARGGFQFMLMIWLQGIWLPRHGYNYARTPLWAGIFMVPFSIGFVIAGPLSGKLSDRYGARPFATGAMLLHAVLFAAIMAFPADFSYPAFATVLVLMGIAGGMFASPNTSSIMNSVPARHRGAASGMRVTFNNAGMPLSMGLFFTLLVLGLNSTVPGALFTALVSHGVPVAQAAQLRQVPPLGYLFAAFLGMNPLKTLLGSSLLSHLSAANRAGLLGHSFFPQLIGSPFKHALSYVLAFAVVMCLVAAVASALRGAKYVYEDEESRAQKASLITASAAPGGALGGPVLEGPALGGAVLEGPALGGAVLEGPALLEGPVLDGPVLEGPALVEPALADTSALPPAKRAPAKQDRRHRTVRQRVSYLSRGPHSRRS
jgi:MFS family permease